MNGMKAADTSVFWLAQAIISLTDKRSKPPVSVKGCKESKTRTNTLAAQLSVTILIYSSSVGHRSESRHRRSRPCPRCRFNNSAVDTKSRKRPVQGCSR